MQRHAILGPERMHLLIRSRECVGDAKVIAVPTDDLARKGVRPVKSQNAPSSYRCIAALVGLRTLTQHFAAAFRSRPVSRLVRLNPSFSRR